MGPATAAADVEDGSPTPTLVLRGLLDGESREVLVAACAAVAGERHDGARAGLAPAAERVREVVLASLAVVRRELDIGHFATAGVDVVVDAHTVDEHGWVRTDCLVDLRAEVDPEAPAQVAFVYTLADPDAPTEGGALRVFDSVSHDGVDEATATFQAFPPTDDTVVFFPADRHHEIGRTRRAGDGPARRWSVTGTVRGHPTVPALPAVSPRVVGLLQRHYLPSLTEHGYEVHPTPAPVQQLLRALFELRRHDSRPPAAHPPDATRDPRLVAVGDLTRDLHRGLEPLVETFAGVPLRGSGVTGLHDHERGATVAPGIGRPGHQVVTALLQVAHDGDDPWPVVLEWDGRREVVALEPGQLLVFESATTFVSRLGPLAARSSVDLSVHFRPRHWDWDRDAVVRRALADGLVDRQGRPTVELVDLP